MIQRNQLHWAVPIKTTVINCPIRVTLHYVARATNMSTFSSSLFQIYDESNERGQDGGPFGRQFDRSAGDVPFEGSEIEFCSGAMRLASPEYAIFIETPRTARS